MLKLLGGMLRFILVIGMTLAVSGAVLLLLAYGLGLLVSGVTHFEPFQATALALGALLVAGIFIERIWTGVIAKPFMGEVPFEYDEQEDDEDEYEDEDYEQDEVISDNPVILHARQTRKPIDFSNVKPDERCPCGSGRKYKNCHGSGQPKTAQR